MVSAGIVLRALRPRQRLPRPKHCKAYIDKKLFESPPRPHRAPSLHLTLLPCRAPYRMRIDMKELVPVLWVFAKAMLHNCRTTREPRGRPGKGRHGHERATPGHCIDAGACKQAGPSSPPVFPSPYPTASPRSAGTLERILGIRDRSSHHAYGEAPYGHPGLIGTLRTGISRPRGRR